MVKQLAGSRYRLPDGLYRVETPYLCAGFIVERGSCHALRADPAAALGVLVAASQTRIEQTRFGSNGDRDHFLICPH